MDINFERTYKKRPKGLRRNDFIILSNYIRNYHVKNQVNKIILIKSKGQHLPHHDKNFYAKFAFRILNLVLYLLTSGGRKPQF